MGARMGVIEAGNKVSRARKRSWRGDLRDAAQNALAAGGYGHDTLAPLVLTVVIVRSRPSTHMGTGRNAGVLKDWAADLLPVQRPDATKVLRAAEDALQGILYLDDSQIVEQHVFKAYGDQCGLTAASEGLFVEVETAASYAGSMIRFDVVPAETA
jgi:Holliday junction resolvase RusA-like endonuclease